jgi:multidrug transporter EmrE-like cation transporter
MGSLIAEVGWGPYVAALISILLSSSAQVLLKMVMRHQSLSLHLLSQPLLYAGFLAYGLSAVLWLQVLSKMPLVVAYPLVSFNFILVALGGAAVLHEDFTWPMGVGIGLIVAGLVVVSRA